MFLLKELHTILFLLIFTIIIYNILKILLPSNILNCEQLCFLSLVIICITFYYLLSISEMRVDIDEF